jgi:hypothetical protein
MPYDSAAETWHHIHKVREAMTCAIMDIVELDTVEREYDNYTFTDLVFALINFDPHEFVFTHNVDQQIADIMDNTFQYYDKRGLDKSDFIKDLLERALVHDQSKLQPPEKAGFDEWTPRLRDLTYGSDEYKAALTSLKPTLDHHYAHNPHHPEHYPDGVEDMSLPDVIEMLCDWRAATLRHADGSLVRSLAVNKDRFGLCDQLVQLMWRTSLAYGWVSLEVYADYDSQR